MTDSQKNMRLIDMKVVNGKRVEYVYEFDSSLSRYLSYSNSFYAEYDIDVSDVPDSILSIPWLSSVLPIAWFTGADVHVEEVDEVFFRSQSEIRETFRKNFPQTHTCADGLIAKRLVNNCHPKTSAAMLFSGGIDSYATYFRHADESPDLITVIGADIPVCDFSQRDRVLRLNDEERLLSNNDKLVITSNLREFYTHHVDLMLPNLGWWGKVQHGMALIGLIAPLSYLREYGSMYIASSYTDRVCFAWGSEPAIDNHMAWADARAVHDGYGLERNDKIALIVKSCSKVGIRPKVRVCYSELNQEVNCSACEKCIRSAFGIVLENDDPNSYGFQFNESIFEKVEVILKSGFSTEGAWFFWNEVLTKFKSNRDRLFLFGVSFDLPVIERLFNYELPPYEPNQQQTVGSIVRAKFILMSRFPRLFNVYKRIRRMWL